MHVKFHMTTRQKTIFGCLQAPHPQHFLLVILIDGLGQHMSAIHRTILKYLLMISLFPIYDFQHIYCKACVFGYIWKHTIHRRELSSFKYGHDFVNDVLFDIFQRSETSVNRKVHVNFLTDPQEKRSTLRPTNVRVDRRESCLCRLD